MSVALVVLVALAVGCGEEVVASPFGGRNAPRPVTTSATGAVQALAPCPLRWPADGETCTTSGLVCEYGDALDPSCSPVAECDGRAWWRRDPACTAVCPRTRAAVTPGAACDPRGGVDAGTGDRELICSYPGELCGCVGDESGAFAWRCLPADAGCPAERPRIGSTCDSPRTCDYGACAFEGGVSLTCTELEAAGSYSSVRITVWLVREPACTGRTP